MDNIKLNTIYNEDCIETMKRMEDNSMDAIITDPPYRTTYLEFDKNAPDLSEYIIEFHRILKDTGWFFMFGTIEMASVVLMNGFKIKFDYVWVKSGIVFKTHNTIRPYNQHEMCYAFVKKSLKKPTELTFNPEKLRTPGTPYYVGAGVKYSTEYRLAQRINMHKKEINNTGYREGTSVLYYHGKNTMSMNERTDHPTQKPLELIELIVNGYTNEEDVVYDPFLGSGTTAVACEKLNRKWIGSEISSEYSEIARGRLKNLQPYLM